MRHPGWALRAAAAALSLATLHLVAAVPTTHTLIATECSNYFTWQTIGIVHTLRKAGMSGPVTRLISCTPEAWEAFPAADKAIDAELGIRTHVAPSYSVHPRTGDEYPGINKPVAVVDWMARTAVEEDYVLVIDADMIMRRPVLPQDLGAAPGTAVSGFFGYMVGVVNELALRHVPEVEPRMDTLAGPEGRRGDQVGGFTLMEREDLRRVGPIWLQLSEDVRFDPKAWNLTGDHYAKEGERPWIAEMYGYSFGCARAGVWHRVHPTAMLYPGYEVGLEHFQDPVRVLHYGILWTVEGTNYTFDKHWHYDFQALACPPWNVTTVPRDSKRGLFAHPPRPSSLSTVGAERLRDLLAIEVTARLNAAFCERHRKHCPPSEELELECGKAEAIAREVDEAFASLDTPPELLAAAAESFATPHPAAADLDGNSNTDGVEVRQQEEQQEEQQHEQQQQDEQQPRPGLKHGEGEGAGMLDGLGGLLEGLLREAMGGLGAATLEDIEAAAGSSGDVDAGAQPPSQQQEQHAEL